MRYELPPLLRTNALIILATLLLRWLHSVLANMNNELSSRALRRYTDNYDTFFEIQSWANQIGYVESAVRTLAQVLLVIAMVLSAWQFVWLYRDRPSPDERGVLLQRDLQLVLDGLAVVESRAATGSEQIKTLRAQEERVRNLLSLNPAQLQSIKESLTPTRRRALMTGIFTVTLALLGFFSGLFPWN